MTNMFASIDLFTSVLMLVLRAIASAVALGVGVSMLVASVVAVLRLWGWL
jgi:hypothetical protein